MIKKIALTSICVIIYASLLGQVVKDYSLFVGVGCTTSENFIINYDIKGIKAIPTIDVSTNLVFDTKSIVEIESQIFYKLILFNQQIFSLSRPSSELSKLSINISQLGLSLLFGVKVDSRWKVVSGINLGYYMTSTKTKNYSHHDFNGVYHLKKNNALSWSIPLSLRYQLQKLNHRANYIELTFNNTLISPFLIELNGSYDNPIDTNHYFFSGDMIRLGYNISL